MSFIAVTGVNKTQVEDLYHIVHITNEYEIQSDLGYVNSTSLVNFTIQNNLIPINFSIDRNKQLVMNCGDFARFSNNGSAVIIAELKTRGGKVLGYRLLSCAQSIIINLRLEDILQREASYGENEHFLQNGIVRNKTVNCYPRKPFNTIIVNESKDTKKVLNKPTKDSVKKETHKQEFTAEQLKEISMCENNGINSRFIRNTKLSPIQMRVLWVSKSKGAYSESFANPRLSSEAMKFYADRIFDKKSAEDCKELLAHPELSIDELSELYACICEGIPYDKYIGKSAVDIRTARDMECVKYWGSSSKFDTDYYEKALGVARKIKGF